VIVFSFHRKGLVFSRYIVSKDRNYFVNVHLALQIPCFIFSLIAFSVIIYNKVSHTLSPNPPRLIFGCVSVLIHLSHLSLICLSSVSHLSLSLFSSHADGADCHGEGTLHIVSRSTWPSRICFPLIPNHFWISSVLLFLSDSLVRSRIRESDGWMDGLAKRSRGKRKRVSMREEGRESTEIFFRSFGTRDKLRMKRTL
jgi:hypothetical protein